MNKSFLNTLLLRLFYLGIWVIFTVIQIFLLSYYLSGSNYWQYILYDATVCNILQAACILVLWYPLKYLRNILNLPLLLLFIILFFLLYSTVWMGLGFLITNTLLSQYPLYPEFFLTILPVRVVFGLLVYVVFVLACYLLLNHNERKTQNQSIEKHEAESSPIPEKKLSRIIVKKNSEFHCLTVSQIRYIEANGDYVLIYSGLNRYLKDQTMKYWETHLPDDNFVRIHRSFIVNIEEVAKIELYEKETYKVHLKNGETLKASSAGYKLLKQKMKL